MREFQNHSIIHALINNAKKVSFKENILLAEFRSEELSAQFARLINNRILPFKAKLNGKSLIVTKAKNDTL